MTGRIQPGTLSGGAIRKVLLMNPPFPMSERYAGSIKRIGTVLPKMGILYVASALENAGYDVQILDAVLEDIDAHGVLDKMASLRPDIVGLSVETPNNHRSKALAAQIKARFDIPIVFGGPHPTLLPDDVLADRNVDYVVIGEGEVTTVELLNTLNSSGDMASVEGIGLRIDDHAVLTPPRSRITNLDDIAFPAYHLVDLSRYRPAPHQYKRMPFATMVTSRGCPFACSFCSSSTIWKRKYTARSVANVMKEIELLYERYGIREIAFWDDLWGMNQQWVVEFCDALRSLNLDISWACSCRVDTVRKDTLTKMAEAGCWRIFYGMESLDNDILKNINKSFDTSRVHESIKWTKEAGIEVHGNFILGLPGETPEKARNMARTVCKLPFDYVKYNVLTPFPGTQVYNEIKAGKWGTFEEKHDRLSLHHVTFIPSGYESFAELDTIRRWATKRFYLRPGYIWKRLRAMRSIEDVFRNAAGLGAIVGL